MLSFRNLGFPVVLSNRAHLDQHPADFFITPLNIILSENIVKILKTLTQPCQSTSRVQTARKSSTAKTRT